MNLGLFKIMTEEQIIKIDDRIEAFLKGKMTWEEEHQFLSDCKTDKELRDRANITALMIKALER